LASQTEPKKTVEGRELFLLSSRGHAFVVPLGAELASRKKLVVSQPKPTRVTAVSFDYIQNSVCEYIFLDIESFSRESCVAGV
jgi:hypothetical protein